MVLIQMKNKGGNTLVEIFFIYVWALPTLLPIDIGIGFSAACYLSWLVDILLSATDAAAVQVYSHHNIALCQSLIFDDSAVCYRSSVQPSEYT